MKISVKFFAALAFLAKRFSLFRFANEIFFAPSEKCRSRPANPTERTGTSECTRAFSNAQLEFLLNQLNELP